MLPVYYIIHKIDFVSLTRFWFAMKTPTGRGNIVTPQTIHE